MTKTIGTIKRQVEYRDVGGLIPYAANSRTHSDAQVAQIAASIREFGWTNPLLIDEGGGLIAGHGRLLAGEMTGRSIHAIELSPAYVDVAVIRWCEFTGQGATLESTGEAFSALRAARNAKAA